MREQRNQKHHEEHKKQNLGNSRSRNGDTAESQEAGDEGNNQENQRVIEHVFLLPLNCLTFLFSEYVCAHWRIPFVRAITIQAQWNMQEPCQR
jgi:hypothetical protein